MCQIYILKTKQDLFIDAMETSWFYIVSQQHQQVENIMLWTMNTTIMKDGYLPERILMINRDISTIIMGLFYMELSLYHLDGIASSVHMLFFETFFSGWFPNPMIFNSEIRSLRNERGVVCREPLGSRQSTSLEWRKVSDRV